ncbi:DUF898 family protein [Jannaschia faecimaris]|nr:DUF898 family protein [Jannaschia faecimaris]
MSGTRTDLLVLVLKTTGLTVLTLGLYSFWARTRIRRWLWSSLQIDGLPFEYAGRPLEKLMGFVIAAVIVAVYLGLVVMLLIFASLNLTGEATLGTVVAFGLLLPVFWFSVYRGQRYLLNHTRWRGIAFSMVPGAGGYAVRAVLWSLGAVLTAGLLIPLRTHRLWKYRAERTLYGDVPFAFDTPAGALYPLFAPVLACAYVSAIFIGMAQYGFSYAPVGLVLTLPALGVFWIRWRVKSFGILASGLRLGDEVVIRMNLSTWRVIGIHLLGWILTGMLMLAAFVGLLFAFGFFAAGATVNFDLELLSEASPYLIAAVLVLFFLTFFVLRGALKIAMVSFPLFRHGAATMVVGNPTEISRVQHGEKAHMADADGFANLFDMGSGI